MHVFVNATYIADLLLSPSTPPRSRMGDLLQSLEVLSKLSAIMAGESTTEGQGWQKGLTGVDVSLRTADVSPQDEEVCDSATEIPYWWPKICPESGQKR